MTNVEKVTEKLNELTEAIKELGGSALVIGQVPDETKEDTRFVIGCLTGKQTDIVNSVAITYGNSEALREIIKTGCALAGLLKLTGGLKADRIEETGK